jgi:hypothetical protein
MEFCYGHTETNRCQSCQRGRSTGPRTRAGKARSRRNSWKHGLTAQEILVVNEDQSKFEALRAELWKQFPPEEGLDSVLVDLLVGYAWRLRRASVIEGNVFANRLTVDYMTATFLPPLTRYEASLLNGFHRTLQQLLALQDRRRLEEEQNNALDVLPSPDDREAA